MDKIMDEAAMVARANDEREKLYLRYDHGREPGADIDPWEDPGFEVYHQTDRYGFIHDKRLPQKTDPNESKAKAIEMERVKKWLKMTDSWDRKKTQEVLHKRIYKGIPDKMRSRVWLKLLNIEKVMAENQNVYQNMLKLARQWSTEARQIDSDVNRQFREHLFYRERYSVKQKSLFNILTAYSMYNTEVGYCQGMSGVAGVLLMYMNEEEAFWALSTILSDKRYAMHGLYIEGFPKLTRFLAHHDNIITKFLPKLKKHFDQYNLDSILYSLKWFFVIFIERIPFSLCLRVWDIYLLDGERVVTAMAYTILRLHKTKLLKLKDMDLIVQYIQTKLHKDFGYDDDYVIKMLEQSMEELRKSKLELPPPAAPNEFPQKPFGLFVEPNFEAKVGIRKSIFSENEREVTNTVILKRDQIAATTAQEFAEDEAAGGNKGGETSGSNSQLNTVHVADSEDGGSLLGSSRKSLADTSVTSTADLSIFSSGQRSQHAYDICVDDARSLISDGIGGLGGIVGGEQDEDEGESSPGSAFCSLSVVGRTTSAMMITPTPHDVVRIYVPPAPPDEVKTLTKSESKLSLRERLANLSASRTSLRSIERTTNGSTFDSRTSSNRNSIISGDATPVRRSFYRSDEELILNNFSDNYNNGIRSSSSSRRGSLGRKSPASLLENSAMMDCTHLIQARRRSSDLSNRTKLNISLENIAKPIGSRSNIMTTSTSSISKQAKDEKRKIMTSFEQLAQQKDQQRLNESLHINENKFTPDDDNFSYSYFGSSESKKVSPTSSTGRTFISESNIHYSKFSTSSGGSELDYHPKQRRLSSSSGGAAENSPRDYVTVFSSKKESPTKNYSRFFSSGSTDELNESRHDAVDVAAADDDDDDDYEDEDKKGSDDSSASPNSKSVLNTPVNDTIPLLLASPIHQKSFLVRKDSDDDSAKVTHLPILSPTSRNYFYNKPNNGSQNTSVSPGATTTVYTFNDDKSSVLVNRPSSKIPLFHHKPMSPTNDLHIVLPPVEITNPPMYNNYKNSNLQDKKTPPLPSLTQMYTISSKFSSPPQTSQTVVPKPKFDFDNRVARALGGTTSNSGSSSVTYGEYNKNRNNQQKSQSHQSANGSSGAGGNSSSSSDMNKIRIKINQNQRN